MELILSNNKRVEVSQEEVNDFITQILIPNPDWRHSELLSEEEVTKFLKGESSRDELRKVARYMLIYAENLAFTAYLFDKADGDPERTREFNTTAIKELREIYRKVTGNQQTDKELAGDVYKMENICLETGADPL